MLDATLEAMVHRHFPNATTVILLAASDPGGVLFRDADPELQTLGIAATSWNAETGILYLRRLPSASPPIAPIRLPERTD